MVKNYLEKTRDTFLKNRIELIERENELQVHLKENIRFIQLLDEANDTSLAAFTPRELNGRNRKKIDELQSEQKEILLELEEIQARISEEDTRINEINSVIKVTRENSQPETDEEKLMILATQENERQRIARDLHDDTVQNLTSLVHKTELCMKLMELDPARCKVELSSLNKILHDVIEETRTLIYDLRPMSFDDIGFDITVERYLDRLKKCYPNIRFVYKVKGEPYQINHIVGITLFRIIQEACNNSAKHAEASNIKVVIHYEKGRLLLEVEDDGKGFSLENDNSDNRIDYSGYGISMMKERVYLLSGQIDIQSEEGQGCKLFVSIPINEEVE